MARQAKKTDSNKPWNRRTGAVSPYKLGSRIANTKRFLIFCEGENSEPLYFKSFKVLTAEVETIGTGQSKTSLVKFAINRLSQETPDPTREIWIVFDMDFNHLKDAGLQRNDFNEAISMAQAHKFKIAYSNDSFELWFLLHYDLLQAALTRSEYYERISALWNISYKNDGKGVKFCQSIYQKLQRDQRASQEAAIRHAERLHRQHGKIPPADQNPCTTVYQLVTELNKHLKK